jgi:26S proteasome regulatory subunit T4
MQQDPQFEALEKHKSLIKEHREKEEKLRERNLYASYYNFVIFWLLVRFGIRDLERKYQKSEDDIKALQSVGQIIGEILKQIDDDKCIFNCFIYLL